MARSCGIRIGPRRFELVVLDGSPKKHRIAAFHAGEFPRDPDDPTGAALAALKQAVKQNPLPADNVGLVVDSGMAAFRSMKLPFDDPDKIEQVLKFEVESQLPQWSIDDVVVDFLPLESMEKGETHLLVSAVPKEDLGAVLSLAERAGIDPQEAELETTAMVNAALSADICHIDDAQVLVHIGETTTSVVVMDSGQVREMRAIHSGALSWERPGTDQAAPEDTGEGDAGAEAATDAEESEPSEDAEERSLQIQQIVARLRRELGRTVSGVRTINAIDAIYVCGIELPGLVGTNVMDVPVYLLDVFEEDSGQPAEGTAPLVVAYGAALRQLGGGAVEARLRREELRFTGKFERVELPLAIASLLLVTWIAVVVIFENAQYQWRSQDVDDWLMTTLDRIEGDPAAGRQAYLQYLYKLPDLKAYVDEIHADHEPEAEGKPPKLEVSPLDRLYDLEDMLSDEVRDLSLDLGDLSEIPQPQSALHGMTLVLDQLSALGPEVGRVAIRELDSSYQRASSSGQDSVRVSLDLTFFADSYPQAIEHFERFQKAIRDRGWEYEDVNTQPLAQGEGAWMDRFVVIVDVAREIEAEKERG